MQRINSDRDTLPPPDRAHLIRTCLVALALLLVWAVASRLAEAQTLQQSPQDLVAQMVANEDAAAQHRPHFFYLASERSDRTQGHLWKERIAETDAGKIRFLIEEDGQPLPPNRISSERGRLAEIVRDPSAFTAAEHAKKSDEDKAKAMLDLLPRAFLVDNPRRQDDLTLIDFHPNPAYQTQSMEEKVLHGMSGTVAIETRAQRLRSIKASLPQDVSVGFGLANIHAGSSFATLRQQVAPGTWKTVTVDTAINGKAILFKSLGKNEHVERTGFKPLPQEISITQAVAMVEE